MKAGSPLAIVCLALVLSAALVCGQDPRVLAGHTGYVRAVAFSPAGRLLASGSNDTTVRLWDANTGTLLRALSGHPGWVSAVVFSADGRLLASASESTIHLWDPASGALVRTLTGHGGWVNSLAFSPDGTLLASGSDDSAVKIWDARSGSLLHTLSVSVSSVAFSPDGRLLASGSGGDRIELWDPASGTPLRAIAGQGESIKPIAFSPDGSTLVSGSWDWERMKATVELWDVLTGKLVRTLLGHTDRIPSVAYSPDGSVLASASYDGSIRLWEASTGTHLETLTGHAGYVFAVAFSPDGATLASGSQDRTVRLWEISAPRAKNVPPVARFAWQVLSPSGLAVAAGVRPADRLRFDASASSDADGVITSYRWDWESDGKSDAEGPAPTAEHAFPVAGSYLVTLEVVDDRGAPGRITETVPVAAESPPAARFTFSPASPSTLDQVQFLDASSDASGAVDTWQWEFGDGSTSAERNPLHRFTFPGTFTVRLTVTDSKGQSATAQDEIVVAPPPPAGQPASPTPTPPASTAATPPQTPSGQVVAVQGHTVTISVGTRHNVRAGDRYEVVRTEIAPDGRTAESVVALLEVAYVIGPDRSVCVVIQSVSPVKIGDGLRRTR